MIDIPGGHLSGTLMFNDCPVFWLRSMDKTFIIEGSKYIPKGQLWPVPQPIYYTYRLVSQVKSKQHNIGDGEETKN